MILSKNFKDFRSENIYNEKINKPNVQLVELIFKKVYDTNTSELEKKTKYRNFFLNRRNKESNYDKKLYDTPIYISQFNYKKKYVEKKKYYRDLATGRKIINKLSKTEVKNLDIMLEKTNIEIYKTKWSRLSESLKLNRIYKFVDFLVKKHNLEENASNFLRKDLFNAIKSKQITKSDQVKYDINNGKILNILHLEYDNNNNKFVLNLE
tara:strand:+ start:718 stop:1344 length:627 start_codon:yes stop_codon:yes gene_type:complete